MIRYLASLVIRKLLRLDRSLGFVFRDLTKDAFLDQKTILHDQPIHTIFDVGANIGQTTKRYLDIFSEARIYSFEPFPDTFQELRQTFSTKTQVIPIELALGDSDTAAHFYVKHNQSSVNSLLKPVNSQGKALSIHHQPISVQMMMLDTFCEQHQIDRINILKLDVQGGELLVLKGAEGRLRESAIDLIYTEVNFVPLYEQQTHFAALYQRLSEHQYMFFDFYDAVYNQYGQLCWADAIFISLGIYNELQTLESSKKRFPLWNRDIFDKGW